MLVGRPVFVQQFLHGDCERRIGNKRQRLLHFCTPFLEIATGSSRNICLGMLETIVNWDVRSEEFSERFVCSRCPIPITSLDTRLEIDAMEDIHPILNEFKQGCDRLFILLSTTRGNARECCVGPSPCIEMSATNANRHFF